MLLAGVKVYESKSHIYLLNLIRICSKQQHVEDGKIFKSTVLSLWHPLSLACINLHKAAITID